MFLYLPIAEHISIFPTTLFILKYVFLFKNFSFRHPPSCSNYSTLHRETKNMLVVVSCGAVVQRGLWSPHFWGFKTTRNDAPPSVGLLWTRDHLVVEKSTWQHKTLIREKYPCCRRDSNPHSQQARGRRPTP